MLCRAVPTTEEALTNRLVTSTIHALGLYGIYLGKELGLYAALRSSIALTPPELAATKGIALRYAREWLEQQAVAGFITVDGASNPADARRYSLPPEHVNVLVAEDHAAHLARSRRWSRGSARALERIVDAYRTGGGAAYPHFGAAFRRGQAGINRPAFLTDLVRSWIPAAPDLQRALTSSPRVGR